MAEEGTLCINADVLKKAGLNASSTSTAEAYTNVFIKMAEGQLSTSARYDWVTNYSSVSTIGKQILKDAASSYAAVQAINYDMSNFNSRQEALTIVNILWASYQKVINLLEKDNNYRDFILTGEGDID
jgi:hypothetical protein